MSKEETEKLAELIATKYKDAASAHDGESEPSEVTKVY